MLEPKATLTDEQVAYNLRRAALLLDQVDVLLQKTFEASDELFETHNTLQDLAGDLEAEADELESVNG